MPTVLISKHEYGPNQKKGELKEIPSSGHDRLVHAYAECPRCKSEGFTLWVRPQKASVSCTSCDSWGSIYDYVRGTADLTEKVEFGWEE